MKMSESSFELSKQCKLMVDMHCFDSDISQGITTYIQGIYTYLPSLAKEFTFFFVARDIEKIRAIFGERKNVNYIQIKSKNKFYRLVFEIPSIIRKYEIDIAHFQYVSPIVKNCKTIVTLHDILFVDYPQYFPFLYRLFKGFAFKISASRSDLLCTVSAYSLNQISYHYGISKNKIVITPNAVSKDFFSIIDKEIKAIDGQEIGKYILYVSRIEPRKNHVAIVDAFERLKLASRGYNLVFIGQETVSTPNLWHRIEKLSPEIKSRIRFISQTSYEELKLWYKNASLFIYPTFAEGFGIPPIEAAACGVPVICNNATAMSDFTFFGKNLIDINDRSLLDCRIMDILDKKEQRIEAQIRAEIEAKYNWKNIAESFYNNLSLFGLFKK